ncbi:MAG: T9SS type A sorting domain-containing protein [Candidatus Cloacimonetes bacterium]|nr:T9SS type A sorting domain-containing protein [Candidatus Cloacimonadota bacterium]
MKKIYFMFLISFTFLFANTNMEIIENSSSTLQLKFDLPETNIIPKRLPSSSNYSQIEFNDASLLPLGFPDIPALAYWIMLPGENEPNISINIGKEIVIEDVNIPPVQPLNIDLIGEKDIPFQNYSSDFDNDQNFPESFYQIEPIKHIRGYYATILWIFPYKYNVVQKRLTYYPDIEVKINFRDQIKNIPKNIKSTNFENMLRNLTLNGDEMLNSQTFTPSKNRNTDRTSGCELLIISDSMFTPAIENLANWKKQRGISTEYYFTDEIGNTNQAIKNFIYNAYNNWFYAPEYILFFGDSDIIPTWYINIHPYTDGGQGRTASDLYYVDMDFPYDLVGDIFSGRISVETLAEANNIVDNIISYEQNPPEASSFYSNAIIAAAFQDGSSDYAPDGYADRRFAKTGEDVRNYLYNNNYEPERIYTTYNAYDNSTVYPTYWNNQSWAVFENDTAGEELPEFLQRPTFAWNGDSYDVTNALNSGSFFLLHRDHGGRSGWGEPDFNIPEVDDLENGEFQPIVWSINCNTGWYDNETDDESCNTSTSSECFTEHWQRNLSGGSCGMIASSRVSYSGINDRLVWGWMDAIFPDFTTTNNDPYGDDSAIPEMGAVLDYGKLYLMAKYPDDEIRRTALEEFHWFGDPTMRMWINQPMELSVNFNEDIMIGSTNIDIYCDVENAVVTLISDNEIVASDQIQGGICSLIFDPIVNSENLFITVNADNYQHFSQEVNLISPQEAYLTTQLIFNDENGNNNGLPDFDENISFELSIENIGNETAETITISVSSTSEFISLDNNIFELASIEGQTIYSFDEMIFVEISDATPDQEEIQLVIEIVSSENEWNYEHFFTVNSPVFEIMQYTINDVTSNNNGVLDPGETVEFQVEIGNIGHTESLSGSLFLISQNTNIFIENEYLSFEAIFPETTALVIFTITANNDIEEGDTALLSLLLNSGSTNIQNDIELIIGLVLENFETGDFSLFPWESEGNAPWTISQAAYEGNFSARTGEIGSWSSTSLLIEFETSQEGIMKFMKKVSSEENYDYFKFFIDGVLQNQWSGEIDWSEENYFILAGSHILEWRYEKDGAVEDGDDAAWLDYVIFPTFFTIVHSHLSVNPDHINIELAQNQNTTEILEISNNGGRTLSYSVFVASPENNRDISGSNISCATTSYEPGCGAGLLFQVFNNGDDENIKKVIFHFPNEIFVNATTNFVGGSEGILIPQYLQGSGISITWENPNGNGVILPGESALAVVSVDFDALSTENLIMNYEIIGDNSGSTPHYIEDEITFENNGEPLNWIQISQNSGEVEAGETDEIELFFDSSNIIFGNYNCELIVHDFLESIISIPVNLTVSSSENGTGTIAYITELIGNYPNPFNPETTINFTLKDNSENVKISIYNIKGQLVKTLLDKELPIGKHSVIWDGTDSMQRKTTSGIYFYKMIADDYQEIQKMILLK